MVLVPLANGTVYTFFLGGKEDGGAIFVHLFKTFFFEKIFLILKITVHLLSFIE